MIREDDSNAPLPLAFSSTDYPLTKLQEVITHYGSQHFSQNGRQPLLYFQVLLLSQQFELVSCSYAVVLNRVGYSIFK